MSFGTWTGRWWLPAAPDHAVAGTLTFSADELTLNLTEPLTKVTWPDGEHTFTDLSEYTTHPLIHGRVEPGTEVTLTNVNGQATLVPFTTGPERWFVHRGFVGVSLTETDPPLFTGLNRTGFCGGSVSWFLPR